MYGRSRSLTIKEAAATKEELRELEERVWAAMRWMLEVIQEMGTKNQDN